MAVRINLIILMLPEMAREAHCGWYNSLTKILYYTNRGKLKRSRQSLLVVWGSYSVTNCFRHPVLVLESSYNVTNSFKLHSCCYDVGSMKPGTLKQNQTFIPQLVFVKETKTVAAVDGWYVLQTYAVLELWSQVACEETNRINIPQRPEMSTELW